MDRRWLHYSVLVPPGCDRERLQSITREIVAGAKREQPFSWIWIQFYDYPELAEIGYRGPPLGIARYGGHTAGRSPTQDGEYAEMTYTYMLNIPDWDKRPSQRDVDLAVYRLQLAREAESHGPERTERELVRRTAKHFGVAADEVEAAVARVDDWVTEPGGRAW